MKYSDQLKHPKWQKQRLKVLELAGWKCEDCGSDDQTLEVHHCFYSPGLKAWEHSLDLLICVCSPCHSRRQKFEQAIHLSLAKVYRHKSIADIEDAAWQWIEIEAKENLSRTLATEVSE